MVAASTTSATANTSHCVRTRLRIILFGLLDALNGGTVGDVRSDDLAIDAPECS